MDGGLIGSGMNVGGSGGGKMMILTPNGDSSSRSMDSSSEWGSSPPSLTGSGQHSHHHHHHHGSGGNAPIPTLLLEIMNVEHLWHCNEQEAQQMQQQQHRAGGGSGRNSNGSDPEANGNGSPPLVAGTDGSDSVSSMCSIADHRLYKIVKWCKSLPLFKNIQVSPIRNFVFRF